MKEYVYTHAYREDENVNIIKNSTGTRIVYILAVRNVIHQSKSRISISEIRVLFHVLLYIK